MGLTITTEERSVEADKHVWIGKIQFDATYPAGGEAIAAKDFGLYAIEDVVVYQSKNNVEWDKAAGKLKVYDYNQDAVADGPAVETAIADQSGLTVRARVSGTGPQR